MHPDHFARLTHDLAMGNLLFGSRPIETPGTTSTERKLRPMWEMWCVVIRKGVCGTLQFIFWLYAKLPQKVIARELRPSCTLFWSFSSIALVYRERDERKRVLIITDCLRLQRTHNKCLKEAKLDAALSTDMHNVIIEIETLSHQAVHGNCWPSYESR